MREKLEKLTVYERRIVEMIIDRILAGPRAIGPWNDTAKMVMEHDAFEKSLDAAVEAAAGMIRQGK
jgi:hypothetical protein